MSDTTWVIKDQTISPDGNTFGTITAYSDSDWSLWIDNNPQVYNKNADKEPCLTHDWVDTGGVKTWCKKCDLSGRWEMGNVVIVREEK